MPQPSTSPPETRSPRRLPSAAAAQALQITLRGRVQGLGVRPAIARLAGELHLCGDVRNTAAGVVIHIEGSVGNLNSFSGRLADALPSGVTVESRADERVAAGGAQGFRIETSAREGGLTAQVPPDVVVCAACLDEVADERDRRYGYAFTGCTQCGPRYSLLESMPYDRPATAMNVFTQCSRCGREYGAASDRRFHAQTNCCPECGPRLLLGTRGGRVLAAGSESIAAAVAELRQGRILALRGVGGYQLVVDAASSSAVRELRRRKHREGKPLAVMVESLAAAELVADFNSAERDALASAANPIVIVRAKASAQLAGEVSAGLGTVGLMLPSTALHHQLLQRWGGPLVVTSGNREGEPLAFALGAAERELADLADGWLDHDRPIFRPIDDSVVRVIAGRTATIRLARGLAPLPLDLPAPPLVALGGHQKAAIALGNGSQCALGPHVGDLEGEASRVRYLEHAESLCRLYGATPSGLACDEHPDYFTTRWAAEQRLPMLGVQHHHAHVAAAMLEQGWLDREVLGVAWDGSGYGADGTIWGGEILLATGARYQRVAHLRPFILPGGELAIRQPWRVAVSLVHQAAGAQTAATLRFAGVDLEQVGQLVRLLEGKHPWPTTTSAGRLFDGVAALALGATNSQFEGQPAMLLEAACDECELAAYPLPLTGRTPKVLDWRPMVIEVLADISQGVSPGAIAMRFHRALAAGLAAVAQSYREFPVVLCGGCFQNRVLTELVAAAIDERQRLATPGMIPTGDGGLAAGQLAVACAHLAEDAACA